MSDTTATTEIHAMVGRFEGPLTLYATRILGDVELARDVVQETFLKWCHQPDEAKTRIEPHLAQWLYTVCRNSSLNIRRKESRMYPLSDAKLQWSVSPEPHPDSALEQQEDISLVLQALDGLPDNQQEVIRLKFQHGMSYRQISSVAGLTTSYVGYLIHAGLKNIREKLAIDQTNQKKTGS